MEQLNKVQLRGYVGNVKTQKVVDRQVCRFSLATNYSYTSKDGSNIVDTTWHNCLAWDSEVNRDFSGILKGAAVEVTGRIRYYKYTGVDGVERTVTEIFVNEFEVIAPPKSSWE